MLLLYSTVLYLSLPLVLLRLLWLGRKNPAYLLRWYERFGWGQPLVPDKPVIWLHAVSVGETQAAKPLVEHLLRQYPHKQVLLTTTTPTGAETVRRLFANRVSHRYFPYDLPGSVQRFLERYRPERVLIMETEIWPNLCRRCRAGNIPVALINARMSERSCRGYRRLPLLTAATLANIDLIAAQTRVDAERFRTLGAVPATLHVTGNLKFDFYYPHSVIEAGEIQKQRFPTAGLIWIAASTHAGEEKLILDAFTQVLASGRDCLLILAPRHPERFQEVQELCRKSGHKTVLHTEREQYSPDTRIYLLNTLGELAMFYAAADIGFVGGSLVPVGGHNMLEPAALGLPVISGPHVFNFAEVAAKLQHAGALLRADTLEQLASGVIELMDDANRRHAMGERGRQVIRDNQGALKKLLQQLQQLGL